MKMESDNPLNKLSKDSRKTNLEKQLDFQEATRPSMSNEYYTSAVDFISHLYIIENYIPKNYEAFPEEFRKYINTVPYNTIFGNGAIKVAVFRIKHLDKDHKYNIEDKKEGELIKKIAKDLKDEFGFAGAYEYSKDPKLGFVLDSYIACFPGKVIKNEKGEWVTEEAEGGTAKFFALLVARGLVDEKIILEDNMANLGVKGIKFREDFLKTLAELRNKNDIK